MLTDTVSLLAAHGAIGMLVAAAVARAPTGPTFHRLTALLSMAGIALGLGLRWSGAVALPAPGTFVTICYVATLAAVLAFGTSSYVAPQKSFVLLGLAATTGSLAVLAEPALRSWEEPAGGLGTALYASGLATVSIAVGSVLFALVLAHWYLVEPRLPLEPLRNVLLLFAAIELLKLLMLVGVVVVHWPEWTSMEGGLARAFTFDNALFVAVKAMLGVLAPLGLCWLAWKTVEIRSIQSATGILYAALVMVLFGETITIYCHWPPGSRTDDDEPLPRLAVRSLRATQPARAHRRQDPDLSPLRPRSIDLNGGTRRIREPLRPSAGVLRVWQRAPLRPEGLQSHPRGHDRRRRRGALSVDPTGRAYWPACWSTTGSTTWCRDHRLLRLRRHPPRLRAQPGAPRSRSAAGREIPQEGAGGNRRADLRRLTATGSSVSFLG